jgi:hypothetical protein
VIVLSRRKLQNGGDIAGFEIRVVREDFVVRGARGKEIEDVFHANPQAPDAGPTSADARIDGNSVNGAHVASLAAPRARHNPF